MAHPTSRIPSALRKTLKSLFTSDTPNLQQPFSLQVETLEERMMLSTVSVTNSLDVVNGDTSSISALVATSGNDGISLREAITAANNTTGSDIITFDSSVFNGQAADVIRLGGTELFVTDSLTIDASAAGGDVTISADSAGDDTLIAGSFITDVFNNTNTSDNSRVLHFRGDGDLTIRGLTLTGGFTDPLTFIDGAGLNFESSGELTVDQSIVSGNSAGFSGGGINADGNFTAVVTITNSTISGNSAARGGGGGIAVESDVVTITDSVITGNFADDYGGGIEVEGNLITITNSVISENTADDGGGGISVDGLGFFSTNEVTTSIIDSTISGNSSGGQGGGLYFEHSRRLANINNIPIAPLLETRLATPAVESILGLTLVLVPRLAEVIFPRSPTAPLLETQLTNPAAESIPREPPPQSPTAPSVETQRATAKVAELLPSEAPQSITVLSEKTQRSMASVAESTLVLMKILTMLTFPRSPTAPSVETRQ